MNATRVASVHALRVAAGLTTATLALAVLVRLAWAAEARERLAFGFAGLPARADTALSIFVANGRLLGALLAATLLIQSRWLLDEHGRRTPLSRLVLAACDTVVALTVALNVTLAGAALGGYGTRMLLAILPHGPLELAALAPALALYLRARRQRQPQRDIRRTTVAGLLALAVAAVLETFVAL